MSRFADLPESEATGRMAEIYHEIRTCCAVPYVSSLQRQLATIPGCLEWLWDALRPAMVDGTIPQAAWNASTGLALPKLPPIPPPALRVLGVEDAGTPILRGVYDTFLRASPVNMVMASLLKHFLASPPGRMRAAAPETLRWSPPAPPPAPPGLPADAALDSDTRALLALFSVDMGGADFVPGLYRLLANWPAYLAHVAVDILPLFGSAAIRHACTDIECRIDGIVPPFVERLMAPPPPFDSSIVAAIGGTLDVYRGTSPQMIVFSAMLKETLPG